MTTKQPQPPKKPSHTPGPWTVIEIFDAGDLSVVLDYDVPACGRPIAIANVYQFDEDYQIPESKRSAELNAKLIAAAPDLLEACKAALDAPTFWPHVDAQLRAAVEKAEGTR